MSIAALKERASASFADAFDHAPSGYAVAPGRVNLIGEHTDYNDGFVLPCAIDRWTVAAFAPADSLVEPHSVPRYVTAVAADFGDARDHFTLAAPITSVRADWANYVRGMAEMLGKSGVALKGAKLAIAGNVPLGSGLSSSAALEVAVGLALCAIAQETLDPTQLARIAQQAENDFVGCACGIMDQLISTRAVAGHALLIDCRSLDCRPVSLPTDMAIIIAHSGVRHAHAGGEYNDRRSQCEAAARHYGVTALRDLSITALEQGRDGLDETAYRRARHVVSENARTIDAAHALERGDYAALGVLMAASHASMRDDFEITVPAVDQLAAIMHASVGGIGGARMTGGGFGGCVIAATTQAQAQSVVDAIAAEYRDPDGNSAEVFLCRAQGRAALD
jgi:galactokinase